MSANSSTPNVAFAVQSMYAAAPIKVKFAPISISADATGGNGASIVAAVTGKKIRVMGVMMRAISGTTPTGTWQSGTTVLTGSKLIPVASATLLDSFDTGPFGLFETASGVALTFKATNADNRFSGYLVYVEVDGNVNQ